MSSRWDPELEYRPSQGRDLDAAEGIILGIAIGIVSWTLIIATLILTWRHLL